MAFAENNFLVANKIQLDKKQFEVECNIDGGCAVKKVLTVACTPMVEGCEVLNGVVNYSGTIDLRVVFETEEGEIDTANASCPFSSKFENEEIGVGQTANIVVRVIDFDATSVSGADIKVLVTLEEGGFVIGNKEIKSISTDDDTVCAREEDIKVVRYLTSASETFTLQSEINLRDKVKKLLASESMACVKSVEAGSNFVAVSGETISRVLYLSENDKFECGYIYDTFKEELEIEGVNRDSMAEACVFVDMKKTEVEIVEDDKGSKIIVKPVITIMIHACAEEEVGVIKDLYCTKNDLAITTESFSNSLPCQMEVVEGKIEGSLSLDEDAPRVDKILFNGGNSVTITNAYVKDEQIVIEGVARTTVVYLNDETGLLNSVQLDFPFTIDDKTDFAESDVISASIIMSDVDVVVKKGRDLFFDAKVKVTINGCKTAVSGVITQVTTGEEYTEKDYAMEVVFAKAGDEAWDIAKRAKVKEAQLLSQNENVIFPLAEDTSLVLFYQKVQ